MWTRGPATDHPIAAADKKLRKFLKQEARDSLAVGQFRYRWMKNLYLGTNPSNAPTFLINGLDVCLKDSPRPVRAYVWLDQSNTDVLHAVGPHVAERFGADVTDWADVDVPDTKR